MTPNTSYCNWAGISCCGSAPGKFTYPPFSFQNPQPQNWSRSISQHHAPLLYSWSLATIHPASRFFCTCRFHAVFLLRRSPVCCCAQSCRYALCSPYSPTQCICVKVHILMCDRVLDLCDGCWNMNTVMTSCQHSQLHIMPQLLVSRSQQFSHN